MVVIELNVGARAAVAAVLTVVILTMAELSPYPEERLKQPFGWGCVWGGQGDDGVEQIRGV